MFNPLNDTQMQLNIENKNRYKGNRYYMERISGVNNDRCITYGLLMDIDIIQKVNDLDKLY